MNSGCFTAKRVYLAAFSDSRMRSLRRSISEDFEVIGAPKRMAKPKKMSLKAAGRRESVMGYETKSLDAIAEGVPKTKKDGPKKMAKPGRKNSLEVRVHVCFRLQFFLVYYNLYVFGCGWR